MQMLKKSHLFFCKTFSTSSIPTPRTIEKWRNQVNQSKLIEQVSPPTYEDWRNQLHQTQLINQVSNIILQRHTNFWEPCFKNLNLHTTESSATILTPYFYFQVFNKIQANPQISLDFFNWAKKNLGFVPDLQTQCKVVHILFGSKLSKEGELILVSLIESNPPAEIVSSIVQTCGKGRIFNEFSSILNCLLECYCSTKMYMEALEVYMSAKKCGVLVSVCSCNVLLNLLCDKNEVDLAWCLYGSMKRIGVMENQLTWSTIAEVLNKCGKIEKVERILDMGIFSPVLYNHLIVFNSRRGKFDAALRYLDEMCSKKLYPSFITYSSILDGACKYQDEEEIQKVISVMVEKRFFPKDFILGCDLLIQKLLDLGKLYAAEFVFKKARDEKVKIRDMSYGCMLQALSKGGRIKDAIDIHQIVASGNILINEGCYEAFLESLCQESPSDEVSESLKDVMGRGFRPPGTLLSKYINSLCSSRKWNQAEELLAIVLDKGFSLDSCCYSSLVERYCSTRRIDVALELHNRMVKLEITFDLKTYTLLLKGLFTERRVEEAERIFEIMRRFNILSSECFAMMIQGLLQEKKFRVAMKLHDEMLKLGLKPDMKTYKRLISGFR